MSPTTPPPYPEITVAAVTIALAVVSVVLAIIIRNRKPVPAFWANMLVGAWVLIPPIWFRLEFNIWRPGPAAELEFFQYGQELSRNIWVALVVALAFITGIERKLKT